MCAFHQLEMAMPIINILSAVKRRWDEVTGQWQVCGSQDSCNRGDELRRHLLSDKSVESDLLAHVHYANALLRSGDARAAVDHLHLLVRSGGSLAKEAWAHLVYAEALLGSGEPGKALEHLRPLVLPNALLGRNRHAEDLYIMAIDSLTS